MSNPCFFFPILFFQISEKEADVTMENEYTKEENKIWEEILDHAIWEFCFDVHRAVKLNYLFLDHDLDPNYKPKEYVI